MTKKVACLGLGGMGGGIAGRLCDLDWTPVLYNRSKDKAEALGRSQGGFSTKLHLRAEGNGRPITAVLTGGERHEQIALEALLDQGAIRRPGRGRPRLRPRRVAGDKGYG